MQEIEVGLVVLDGVLASTVLLLVDLPLRFEAPFGEQRLDDLDDELVLIDAVAAPLRQQPQLRHECQLIGRLAPGRRVPTHLLDALDDPGPVALDTIVLANANRCGLADDRVDVHVRPLARSVALGGQPRHRDDVDLERTAHRIMRGDLARAQLGLLGIGFDEEVAVRHQLCTNVISRSAPSRLNSIDSFPLLAGYDF